jgi:hypothetical protein
MGVLLTAVLQHVAIAQELFVFTEPASNMPKGLVGGRLTNILMGQQMHGKYQYNLLPEVMIGVSKKLMLHAEAMLSNRGNNFSADGGSLYAKYRFLSKDDVQQHFRMAAFGRVSYNNSPIMQQDIETAMYNSGFEGGLVATQLLHKVALSSTVSYERATNNGGQHVHTDRADAHALNYSLSGGKLMLPKHYKSFGQTNLNLMVELLGQYNTGLQKSYLDVAPSVQFIFNSRWRLDAGYRQQLYSGLQRMSKNSFLLRLEYNFFNVF